MLFSCACGLSLNDMLFAIFFPTDEDILDLFVNLPTKFAPTLNAALDNAPLRLGGNPFNAPVRLLVNSPMPFVN